MIKDNTRIKDVFSVEQTEEHIHISFRGPRQVLSSAVLNGGYVQAQNILNRKVPVKGQTNEAPDLSLRKYASAQGWKGSTVGMMTAAPMNTLCIEHAREQGIELSVLTTSGMNNARRAGDTADVREILTNTKEAGTINMVVICSARLTEAAMVEALMIATEAKAAALQELNVISPVSQKIATGTGTDTTVIVSGEGPEEIAFCGKHVLLGELIGTLTIRALKRSIAGD